MMQNKGMQQSRNKRAGFACKYTHGLLMPYRSRTEAFVLVLRR